MTRPALSNLLNQNASLSPEMGLRIEKAFGFSMDDLVRMQCSFDIAQARLRQDQIVVGVRKIDNFTGDQLGLI